MMIDCNKAGELMERREFEKIGWAKKRKLKFHIRMCELCQKYEKDNEVLARIIRMVGIRYTDNCIAEEEKKRIKKALTRHQSS